MYDLQEFKICCEKQNTAWLPSPYVWSSSLFSRKVKKQLLKAVYIDRRQQFRQHIMLM